MAKNHIYKRNSNFFEKIDSQEKAYWLGYLYADGCVLKRGNSYAVSAHSTDLELLEALKSSLEYGGSISTYKYGKSSFGKGTINSLKVHDSKIGLDLIAHGCIPQKTFKLKFPDLEKNLRSHFIRGYFDGDGSTSLYFSKPKNKDCINVSISGIEVFLKSVMKEYAGLAKFVYQDKRKTTDCWNIKINGDQSCLDFLDYIYKDATIYLLRKKEKYDIFTKRFNDYNKQVPE